MSSKINKDIQKIADEARNSISKYCIEECRAFCCRNGYLLINPKSIDTVTHNNTKELIEKGLLKKLKNGYYSLFLGNFDIPCKSLDLKDFTCNIHKNKLRPKACRDFPLIIEENTIKLSPRCPAVRENRLYPYIKLLIKKGLRYVKYENIPELSLYNIEFK
jgi:Fe-S-cluster containining protein